MMKNSNSNIDDQSNESTSLTIEELSSLLRKAASHSKEENHQSIVEQMADLLNRGANPNIFKSYNNNALHWSIKTGNPAAVKLLLDNGADVTLKNPTGQSAIYIAAQYLKSANEFYEKYLKQEESDNNPLASFTIFKMVGEKIGLYFNESSYDNCVDIIDIILNAIKNNQPQLATILISEEFPLNFGILNSIETLVNDNIKLFNGSLYFPLHTNSILKSLKTVQQKVITSLFTDINLKHNIILNINKLSTGIKEEVFTEIANNFFTTTTINDLWSLQLYSSKIIPKLTKPFLDKALAGEDLNTIFNIMAEKFPTPGWNFPQFKALCIKEYELYKILLLSFQGLLDPDTNPVITISEMESMDLGGDHNCNYSSFE